MIGITVKTLDDRVVIEVVYRKRCEIAGCVDANGITPRLEK
jgi:hypothetical protein